MGQDLKDGYLDALDLSQIATIANGASLSGIVFTGGYRLYGIVMPAAWTTANLSFQGSIDGTNFNELFTGSAAVAVTAAAALQINVTPGDFAAVTFLKIRSGTSGSPVNQGAARAIQLILQRRI